MKKQGRILRSGGIGSGPGEGFRACQRLGDAFQFPKKDLASAVRLFRAPEECTVPKDVRQSRLRTITAILPGSKCSCLLVSIGVAGCIE